MSADSLLPETMVNTKFTGVANGSLIDNRYKIISTIGKGGMGIVYKAQETSTQRFVAIKFLTDSYSTLVRKRFAREMELASKLDHPYIVQIISAGKFDEHMYMVMDYIEGIPLDEYYKRNKLSLREKLEIVYKIALAIQYAHRKRIIHRDLKPDNIIMTANGEPKVMDFGLAKLIENQEHELTKTGDIMGTPRYMSPEQISGKTKIIDERTDVYSLGTILYELVMSREMISGDSVVEILYNIVHQCPKSLGKNIPKLVQHIWRNSVAPRSKRYKDASILATEIKIFLDDKDLNTYQKLFYWIKKYQTILAFSLFFIGTLAFILVYKNYSSDIKQEISEITNDNERYKIIENLIDNKFFLDAEEEWSKIKQKSEPKAILLQLQIWNGNSEYEKVWNYPSEQITPIVAALKIKAGYYLEKDLETDIVVKKYAEIITSSQDQMAQYTLQKYLFFFLYHKKAFSSLEEKYSKSIKFYENSISTFSFNDSLDLFLTIGYCYLSKTKEIQTSKSESYFDYLPKATECYRKALMINKNSFDALKGFADCILQKEHRSPEEIEQAREYLQKCCELRPNDWETRVMLARSFIGNREEHYLAYVHFEKACAIGKNATKPLEATIELCLKDSRYQDKVFWLLLQNVLDRQQEKAPDFLLPDILAIRQKNQACFIEYASNIKEIDVDLMIKTLATTDDLEMKITAQRALIIAGYRKDISKSIEDYTKQNNANQNVFQSICRKVNNNKRSLLEYLLADLYLYDNTFSENELFHKCEELKTLLTDKKEHILIRFLAAKALLKICDWNILIENMDSLYDPDLLLICHVALYEAGFIFPVTQLENPDFHVTSYYQIILYGRFLCLDKESFVSYLHRSEIYVPTASLVKKMVSIIENVTPDTPEKYEIMRCIAAVTITKTTGNHEIWNKYFRIIQKAMKSKNNIVREYAHYFYWQSNILQSQLVSEIEYARYLNEYMYYLESEEISVQEKLMILNAKNLYSGEKSKVFFEKNPTEKEKLVKILEKILIFDPSDLLRFRVSQVIGTIISYGETFKRIIKYSDLPFMYRTLVYTYVNVNIIMPLYASSSVKTNLWGELNKIMEDIKKLWDMFQEIMNSKDNQEFKGIVYQLAALMGGKHLVYLDHPNTTEEVKSTIMMCLTRDSFPEDLKIYLDFIRLKLNNYRSPSSKEQIEKVSTYKHSESANTQTSAWASYVFLTPDENIDGLYAEVSKLSDVEKSAMAFGLQYKIGQNLTTSMFDIFRTVGYKTFYEAYINEIANNSKPEEQEKNLKYLVYAENLERNKITKSLYQYQQAVIYKSMQKKDKALEQINNALKNIENVKDVILEAYYMYNLFKISLYSDSQQSLRELQKILPKINKMALLKEFIEITNKFLNQNEDRELWCKLNEQAIKRQLLLMQTLRYDMTTLTDFIGEPLAKIHQKLMEYNDNPKIKLFHNNAIKLIDNAMEK